MDLVHLTLHFRRGSNKVTKYLSASLIYKEDNTAIDLIIVMLHMILQISDMQKQNCKFRTCTQLYIKICILIYLF